MSSYTERFQGLFNLTGLEVRIVGAGGIGSFVTLILAKMGAQIKVYDFDEVDIVNVGTQMYSHADIGRPKVLALAEMANAHSGETNVQGIIQKIDVDTPAELFDCDVVISALDSIEARKETWSVISNGAWSHFLDMRMGAELCTIYTVSTVAEMERYMEMLTLQNSEDIPELACTMKATVYTAYFAAAWAATIIRRLLMDMKVPFILSHDIIGVNITTN